MPTKETDEFVLKIKPDTVVFPAPSDVSPFTSSFIELSNPTKEAYAFKVKGTNNAKFRIKLPTGFIKPDETVLVPVIYLPGSTCPKPIEYFSICYIKLDPKDNNESPRDFWKAHKKKMDGGKRVYITIKEDEKKIKKKSEDIPEEVEISDWDDEVVKDKKKKPDEKIEKEEVDNIEEEKKNEEKKDQKKIKTFETYGRKKSKSKKG